MSRRRRCKFWSAALVLALLAHTAAADTPVKKWPDLSVLTHYPNPGGTTCGMDGKPGLSTAARTNNRLKNRFQLGDKAEELSFAQMISLKPRDSSQNNRYVSVVGYVQDVKPGYSKNQGNNCDASQRRETDTHIELLLSPNEHDHHGVVILATTERIRRLAQQGLLLSNIGNDWSEKNLRKNLFGKWVRFTGWLYYDREHEQESWVVDPEDKVGRKNWRQTAWELHPVMGIEVLPGLPSPTSPLSPAASPAAANPAP